MARGIWTVLIVGWLGLSLAACGYRFAGGGSMPEGIRFVGISMLENRTSETGVEDQITNSIIYEFTRSGSVTVTDPARAEAVLSGVINRILVDSIAFTSANVAQERRVTIYVDLTLTGADGRVIWTVRDMTANEDYPVESDKLATERNKREAIAAASERLAERAFRRMTEDF